LKQKSIDRRELLFNRDSRTPLLGGLAITIVGFGASFLIGDINSEQGHAFVVKAQNNINALCSVIIFVSATILTLMFTVLSISTNSRIKLKSEFYRRIKQIALYDILLFVITTLMFLIFNFPAEETGFIPTKYYKTIFHLTVFATSFIGGLLVALMLMIYFTINDLTDIFGFRANHPMVFDSGEEKKSFRAPVKKGS